jgi:cytochrome P450
VIGWTALLTFVTFQRQLITPFTLSTGTILPANSYISMAYYPVSRDPAYYPSPEEFIFHRFSDLRNQPRHEDKHQFTSIDKDDPLWTFGKFACPGRQWASAQIKLLLMVLLLEFEVEYEGGWKQRPVNEVVGGKFVPSMRQKIVLSRRARR